MYKFKFRFLIIFTALILYWLPTETIKAVDKKITINDFILMVLDATGFGTTYQDAIDKGIVTSDQFSSTSEYITNQDAASILNNVYLILNGIDKKYEELLLYGDDYIEFNYNAKLSKCYWIEKLNQKNVNKFLKYFRKDVRSYIKDENYRAVPDYEYVIASIKYEDYLKYDLMADSESNLIYLKEFIQAIREIDGFDNEYALCLLSKICKDNMRISDISKAGKSNRDSIYRMYSLGIMIGFSKGNCATSRIFKPTDKVTLSNSKEWIDKLINIKSRRIIAPDGQLTRTTNLPYNADEYPYILDSFPNEYYSMKRVLTVEASEWFATNRLDLIGIYTYSKNQLNPKYESYDKDDEFYRRIDKRETSLKNDIELITNNLNTRFNLSYKTIDNKWINKLLSTYDSGEKDNIKKYVKTVKKYKVTIKATQITVEKTGNNGAGYRCYVKFTVTWKGKPDNKNKLIYSCDENYLDGLQNGKSIEAYFDLDVIANTIQGGFCKDCIYSYNFLLKNNYFKTEPLKLVKLTTIEEAYNYLKRKHDKQYADKWKLQIKYEFNEYGAMYYWK